MRMAKIKTKIKTYSCPPIGGGWPGLQPNPSATPRRWGVCSIMTKESFLRVQYRTVQDSTRQYKIKCWSVHSGRETPIQEPVWCIGCLAFVNPERHVDFVGLPCRGLVLPAGSFSLALNPEPEIPSRQLCDGQRDQTG